MSAPARLALRGLYPMVPAYLAEVADLWVASWTRTLPAIDFEARRGWFVDHVTAAMARGETVRVAITQTGEIAGMVMIDPGSGYLDQIVVGIDWWGQGVAEALIDAARQVSPARVALTVNQDNPRAVAFYRRLGFRVTGEGANPVSGLKTLDLEWRPARAGGA